MEVGTRIELVDEQMRKIETVVAEMVPEVVASVVRIGGSGGSIQASLGPAAPAITVQHGDSECRKGTGWMVVFRESKSG